MRAIRSLLFYLVLALTIIPLSLVLILSVPFTASEFRYDGMRAWGRFMLRSLELICGVKQRVIGMGNCPDGPAVVMCKHQSAWECFWLGSYLPRRGAFIYKKSLDLIPFFGWALKSVGLLSIDRSKGKAAFQSFMERGPEFLKKGWWILIFPEGTRVPPGQHVRYKSGGVRLAVADGTPILPIALDSGLCWPKDSFAKFPGTVTVSIGRPIPTAGRNAHEVNAEVEAWIESETRRLIEMDHPDFAKTLPPQ